MTFRDGVNKGEPYWDWSNYTYHAPDNTGYDDGIVTKDDMVQINHYYPFGLNMEGDWNGAPGKNKYQYNEKEWNEDFGLGWNHHDWRFYDVAIGRFVTIDRLPEEEEQEQLSPYHFSYDNPIRYSDPDGQCPTCPAAAVGAAIGGLVGGLVEIGSQLYNNHGVNNWSSVGAASVQGAVTGAAAGLTAGASLLTTTATAAVANGIGGAASNAIQGKPITVASVAKDVVVGAVTAGITSKATEVLQVTPLKQVSGTAKPVTSSGIPNSRYTHLTTDGKAVQNAVYDKKGKVIGHVDFKNHGRGAASGHGHKFPVPGNPASGHGAGKPHIPYNQLPKTWKTLPKGVSPVTPIGH